MKRFYNLDYILPVELEETEESKKAMENTIEQMADKIFMDFGYDPFYICTNADDFDAEYDEDLSEIRYYHNKEFIFAIRIRVRWR